MRHDGDPESESRSFNQHISHAAFHIPLIPNFGDDHDSAREHLGSNLKNDASINDANLAGLS